MKPLSGLLVYAAHRSPYSTASKSNEPFDYQYLEKSQIPTLKFQKSLMRLPIPKLEDTVERYLTALKPIIPDANQYTETVSIANKFRENEGKVLHEKLVKKDKCNKHTSYITEPWFDMYLTSRLPLVLNYAPFLAWKPDPDPQYMALPIRSTNMVISALRFRRSLVENVLTPEIFHLNPAKSDTPFYRKVVTWAPEAISSYVSMAMKAFPLDMSQYSSLFNSTRIPKVKKDQLCKYPNSKHIVVIKNGQFYSFDVLDANGNIRPAQEILSCLSHLINLKVPSGLDSVTALSAEERDTWAEVREKLVSSSRENSLSLETVDSAIFTLSLDDLEFGEDMVQGAHNFLHGNSSKQGSKPCNRWFDKSFGLIFANDGQGALTFEHSWGDGVAVLRVFNEMYQDSTKNRFVTPSTTVEDASNQVKHLPFKLPTEVKQAAAKADENWRKFTSSLDINYTISSELTRDYFKKKKLSPDSMFQLAFQMAFYRCYKTFTTTYESSSTAGFKHGRTEVVRAATNETTAATLAFESGDKSAQELHQLLNACSKKHGTLTTEAAMGKGFDRHLFAMRKIAEAEGHAVPALYKDKSYIQATHFVLSTSSLYGSNFSGGGFAPVVQDGYGLGYGYVDENLGVLCTSFKGQRDGKKFIAEFSLALKRIKDVLDQI